MPHTRYAFSRKPTHAFHVCIVLCAFYFSSAYWQSLKAQDITILPFRNHISHAEFINPTFWSRNAYQVSLGTGMLHFDVGILPFSSGELNSSLENNRLSLPKLIENVDFSSPSETNAEFFAPVFSYTIRTDEAHYMSFGINMRGLSEINLPTSLLAFMKGFNSVEGEEDRFFEFDNANARAVVFSETYFTYGLHLSEKFKVGARVKLLNGWYSFLLDDFSLRILTEFDTFDTFFNFENGVNASVHRDSPLEDPSVLLQNIGGAIDIGMTWQAEENFAISLAVNNLFGTIFWGKPTMRFVVVDKTIEFSGVNINTPDQLNSQFYSDAIVRLLEELRPIQVTDKSREIITRVPIHTIINFDYNYEAEHYVSAVIDAKISSSISTIKSQYSILYNYNFDNWLYPSGSVHYDVRNNLTFGLGLGVDFYALKFFIVTDDIVSNIIPSQSRNYNLSVGLSFGFGDPLPVIYKATKREFDYKDFFDQDYRPTSQSRRPYSRTRILGGISRK